MQRLIEVGWPNKNKRQEQENMQNTETELHPAEREESTGQTGSSGMQTFLLSLSLYLWAPWQCVLSPVLAPVPLAMERIYIHIEKNKTKKTMMFLSALSYG